MELTEKEHRFLEKRRRLLKLWPLAGSLLLSILAGLTGWLFWKSPMLINPHFVWNELQTGNLAQSSLVLLAGLLPVTMLLTLLLCLVVLFFTFAAFRNEKLELDMIQRLLEQ